MMTQIPIIIDYLNTHSIHEDARRGSNSEVVYLTFTPTSDRHNYVQNEHL